jgi:hypothetical protein
MTGLRAVPSRVWSAVLALVVLASLGIALVLGAGLHVWQGTVGSAPGIAADQRLGPRSGVVTVPSRPHARPPHQQPVTPPTVTPPGTTAPVPVVAPPTVTPPVTGSGGSGSPATGHPRPVAGGGGPRPVHPPVVRLTASVRHLLEALVDVQGTALHRQAARTVALRALALREIAHGHLAKPADVRRFLLRRVHLHSVVHRQRAHGRAARGPVTLVHRPTAMGRARGHRHGHRQDFNGHGRGHGDGGEGHGHGGEGHHHGEGHGHSDGGD